MRIAVAAGPETVPGTLAESVRLLVIETDNGGILAERPGPDGMGFAELALEYRCEAVACGKITEPDVFGRLAENGVTRYYTAGLAPLEAARAAEDGRRPIMTRIGEMR